MVPGVRDKNLILAVTSHIPGIHELSNIGTSLSKLQQKLTWINSSDVMTDVLMKQQ